MTVKLSHYLYCLQSYDGKTKWKFFIKDADLLEKYNTVWDKVSTDIQKEFNSKNVYNNF